LTLFLSMLFFFFEYIPNAYMEKDHFALE
jgi:hypothetical protein